MIFNIKHRNQYDIKWAQYEVNIAGLTINFNLTRHQFCFYYFSMYEIFCKEIIAMDQLSPIYEHQLGRINICTQILNKIPVMKLGQKTCARVMLFCALAIKQVGSSTTKVRNEWSCNRFVTLFERKLTKAGKMHMNPIKYVVYTINS